VRRREDLTTPRRGRRIGLGVHYDPEAFGQFSETIAHLIGTARFLVFQTIVIVAWIGWNVLAPERLQFDPYDRGLVLLTLVLSVQAAYAAPLILLAQNRQESRERSQLEMDRRLYERTQADTEFLARELTSMRLAMSDVVTNEDLDDRISQLAKAIEHLSQRLDGAPPGPAD
jgi:uncharacterized membrane protein